MSSLHHKPYSPHHLPETNKQTVEKRRRKEELTSKIHCSLRMQEFRFEFDTGWALPSAAFSQSLSPRQFTSVTCPKRTGGKRLEQNRIRMRALIFEIKNVFDIVNSRKLWFFKKPLWIFAASHVADRLWEVIRMLSIVLWGLISAPLISSFQLKYRSL